jgi:hypothetical protein
MSNSTGPSKVVEIVREKWKQMTEKKGDSKKRKNEKAEQEPEVKFVEKRHKGESPNDPIVLDDAVEEEVELEEEEGEDPFDNDDFVAFHGDAGLDQSFNFEVSARPPWMPKGKRTSF